MTLFAVLKTSKPFGLFLDKDNINSIDTISVPPTQYGFKWEFCVVASYHNSHLYTSVSPKQSSIVILGGKNYGLGSQLAKYFRCLQ